MLRVLAITVVLASSIEAFVSPRFQARSPSLASRSPKQVLLWSIADKPQVDEDSTFDSIEDSGDDIPEVDGSIELPSEEGIEKMLNKALVESVQSVQEKLPEGLLDEDSMNIMKDDGFKAEISEIFDKASLDLKDALDDIRKEQEDLAQQSAERSAEKAMIATKVERARMDQAEASMVKMIGRVNKEAGEVERAVDDLKKAQEGMSRDPIMKLASGSIVKQASLAGTILFTLRSGVDTVAMLGGDASHAIPALLQGAIALACAAYFSFA